MSYRRYMMSRANKLILGIDFSKQPDDEVWYIKSDGEKAADNDRNLLGGYGKQEGLLVLSNTYQDGLGKIKYNKPVLKFGEGVLRFDPNLTLVSLPKRVEGLGAFSLGEAYNYIDRVVFLSSNKISMNASFKPYIKKVLYVQPNCAQYYKELGYNIIEKKI